MEEIDRVRWVVCPKCKYRYYLSHQLLMERIPAICPKCRLEFDPVPCLEAKGFGRLSRTGTNQ